MVGRRSLKLVFGQRFGVGRCCGKVWAIVAVATAVPPVTVCWPCLERRRPASENTADNGRKLVGWPGPAAHDRTLLAVGDEEFLLLNEAIRLHLRTNQCEIVDAGIAAAKQIQVRTHGLSRDGCARRIVNPNRLRRNRPAASASSTAARATVVRFMIAPSRPPCRIHFPPSHVGLAAGIRFAR